MRALVIINPISGSHGRPSIVRRRIELATRALREHDVAGRVVVTAGPRHGYELAKDAAEAGVDVVFAWGGDGTVNEVGSALAFGTTPLAIIPAGSGNGLARELRIPRSPRRAFRAALAGRERVIDAGTLSGRLFFNVAGIGVDALVAERFNQMRRGRRGALRYLVATIGELRRYEPPRYGIVVDGERTERRALLIAFANGTQYGYGVKVAPDASLDDGLLELVVAEERPYWSAIWDARHLLRGTVSRAPRMTIQHVERTVVDADREMLVHLDGETFRAAGPLEVGIRRGALRVRVPEVSR